MTGVTFDEGTFSLAAPESNPATPEKDSSLAALPRNDMCFELVAGSFFTALPRNDMGFGLGALSMEY